ncbi:MULTISPECIES: cysteine hydrolase family protein [Rhizobium]|uniref:Isochorismatase-family hydrolase n=1 Tax=Rhizobium favelukesii TaxID=348824 RepID=W6R4G0_9HYPH|nr:MULTISPECIES: cysteine hydrolase family protein [Rhizobium]MCS0461584.1 cysteine hydrolase [Rhizobium favelukesii]UFS82114.1 cysteine hydrolase [Rhizobium sp. T136]CDM56212.1 putative isochorismatase-family hydrolase [Rhizobium favelukesii]
MHKRALIVVDIQNDYFPNGKWPLSGAETAADNAARIIAAARDAGELVIHIRHESVGENAAFFLAGSEGAQIHPKVLNRPGETVIVKNHVNSFRETDLKATLDRDGIEDVTVVGSMRHMCIDAVTRAASDFGYRVTVIHDACAMRDLEFNGTLVPAAQAHAAFMAGLAFAYASVLSTNEALAMRGEPRASAEAGDN